MKQEKQCLTWHTYPDYLREIMQEMMTSEAFADVTMVTDDKRIIKAHRSILSTCSPVFKEIFQMEASQHSVIYLSGIQYSEMESIMQFLYLGEARFREDRVNELLSVSKNLEIEGLSSEIDKTMVNLKEHRNEFSNHFSVQVNTKISRKHDDASVESEKVFQQVGNDSGTRIKSEIDAISSGKSYLECIECQRVFNSQPALMYHKKSRHEGLKYKCDQCDHHVTSQSTLKRHIQSKHTGINYACNQCDYQAARQDSLNIHIQSKHEGVKYACNQCDYLATTQSNLTTHIKMKHRGVRYDCDHCDYQATQYSHLKTHTLNKHNVCAK